MIVTHKEFEYEILPDSSIQERIMVGELILYKETGKEMTEDNIRNVVDNPKKYAITSVLGTYPIERRRIKCMCGKGYINIIEEDIRKCETCGEEYLWNGTGYVKVRFIDPVARIDMKEEHKGTVIRKINDAANKFRMVNVTPEFDRKHRSRNWNNLPKEIVTKRKIKLMCDDGRFRYFEFDFENKKVTPICTYLNIEKAEIGEEIASIQEGHGAYAGYLVLVIKDYSGYKPPKKMEYFIIEPIENYQRHVIKDSPPRERKIRMKSRGNVVDKDTFLFPKKHNA